jgi:hypothetical protein
VAAIKNLKNHKAPGDDMLPAKLFKAGSDRLIDVLHGLILQVWSEEKLPEEWKTGVICLLHKKGCTNTLILSLWSTIAEYHGLNM